MDLLGGRICIICGFKDIRALQIEHKNGGGREEAKNFTNSYEVYKYYLKHKKLAKERLQVMCSNL